jgi:hypothetical protein
VDDTAVFKRLNDIEDQLVMIKNLHSKEAVDLLDKFTSSLVLSNQYYYSFNTYEGCVECSNGYFVWVAEVCLTQNTIVVITPVGFGQGDIVKLKYGTSDYFCATLTNTYDPLEHYSITSIHKTDDVTSYSDCETCDATTTINLSVKECNSPINSYISLPITIWYY